MRGDGNMNIAQAMEHIKNGSICKIHGIYVKLDTEGHLVRDYSWEFKLSNDKPFEPTLEQMLSNDWELVDTYIESGSYIRMWETDLRICSGYRGRYYLLDEASSTIVADYENVNLLLKEMSRNKAEILYI